MIGIYKITSPSQKIYIGQSTDIQKRFEYYNRNSCKGQVKLYKSLIKYGFKNHISEIIEICDEEDLNVRERYWQEYYNVLNRDIGLNCILTQTVDRSGFMCEDSKLKMKIWHQNKKLSKSHRENIRLSQLGRIKSKETIYNSKLNRKDSKLILDLNTGVFYNSLSELTKLYNFSLSTLSRQLTGKYENKTPFIYV